MTNHWSGGQYSLFRYAFGLYLVVHCVQLLPWAAEVFSSAGVLPQASASPLLWLFPNILALVDAPWFVTLFVGSGVLAALSFMLGYRDRIAAVWLWYVLACLFGRNPLTSNPSLPFVGWMLLAHLFVPSAPYGSWQARGRIDPGGEWQMPPQVFAAAWIVMSVAYSYSGYNKLLSPSWVDGSALWHVLQNPLARPEGLRQVVLALPSGVLRLLTWGGLGLELLFAPLALIRGVRPWLWGAMVLMHLALVCVIDFADLSIGMLMLHLLTFDPAWVPPLRRGHSDTVFYDGHCGLCHGTIRWLLAEDGAGALHYAPLQSAAFAKVVPEEQRQNLPDSVAVVLDTGALLTRSTGIIYLLKRLGGLWRVLGWGLGLIPAVVRDLVYRGVAASRHAIFKAPEAVCPILPVHLRERFLSEVEG